MFKNLERLTHFDRSYRLTLKSLISSTPQRSSARIMFNKKKSNKQKNWQLPDCARLTIQIYSNICWQMKYKHKHRRMKGEREVGRERESVCLKLVRLMITEEQSVTKAWLDYKDTLEMHESALHSRVMAFPRLRNVILNVKSTNSRACEWKVLIKSRDPGYNGNPTRRLDLFGYERRENFQ